MRPQIGGPRGHPNIISNGQRTSTTTTPTPGPSSSQSRKTTTCLFCRKIVQLSITSGEPIGKLEKSIRLLYKHLKIPSSELPQRFTREMFPFCTSCELKVEEVKKQDLIIVNALEKMKKATKDIEQAVVDMEILGNRGDQRDLVTLMLEERKCTKTPELILQGYRQKLLRKHHGDVDVDNYILPEDDHGFNEQVDNEQMEEIPQDYQNADQSMEEEQVFNLADVKLQHVDQLENVTISVINNSAENDDYFESPNLYLETTLDEQGEDEYDEQGQQEHEEQLQHQESSNWSENPNVTALYNEQNCTLQITKTESLQNANSVGTSLVQIKQEAHPHQDADVEQEDSDDVFILPIKKRRFRFEGTEIYRVNGVGKRAKLDYLQCSLCNYTLPVQKNNKSKGSSVYMKMKTHILYIHQRHSGPPKAARVRNYACVPCNLTFDSSKDMRDHKTDHPPEVALECDICAKPMRKGTGQKAFLNHKFSHKNAEERRASIAAEKMRSNNSIQSNQLNVASSSSTPKAVRKRNVQRKVEQRRRQRQASSVAKGSGTKMVLKDGGADPIARSHVCEICDRRFGRKCHLERHRSASHNQPSMSSRNKVSQTMPFLPMSESPN